jgi:hypothetical protein
MGVHNPVRACLRRDLEAQRQLGLPKHSPAALYVLIRVIRGSQNDFAANDFSASTNEDHFLKSSLWLPVPITKSGNIQNFQRSVFLERSRAYSGWLRTNSGERGFRGSFRLFANCLFALCRNSCEILMEKCFSFSKKLKGRQLMAEREKSAFSRSLSVLRFLPADSKLFESQNSQSAWY